MPYSAEIPSSIPPRPTSGRFYVTTASRTSRARCSWGFGSASDREPIMSMNRRTFIALPGAAMVGSLWAAPPAELWHQKIRRMGQVNMTERDPVEMNVEEWADYWASLKVDAVQVSVTGILAFYPSKVPYHRHGKYLGDRDFFGDCCNAAKKRGLHVLARMSPDLEWEEALEPHPEWFERNAQGKLVAHTEEPRLCRTCMFTTYFTE